MMPGVSGVSGVSQISQGTTNVVRVVDTEESNSTTVDQLMNSKRPTDQRVMTQQIRKTRVEIEEELKFEEQSESQSGSQFA